MNQELSSRKKPDQPFQHVTYDTPSLIPAAWQSEMPVEHFFAYNPSIVWQGDHYVMVYRVVTPGWTSRRVAACRLDRSLAIQPGSIIPLSDRLPSPGIAYSDPRLVVYRQRLWMQFFNNHQPDLPHLVELDPDTLAARGPVRPIELDGSRQAMEKNWMLFEHEGELLAEYTITPHVILRLNLDGPGPIHCQRIYQVDWDASVYSRQYGEPRGGSPPIKIGDTFYTFFHSSHYSGFIHPWLRRLRARLHVAPITGLATGNPTAADPASRRKKTVGLQPFLLPLLKLYTRRFVRIRYLGGFYGFSAQPPFAPCWLAPQPVLIPEVELPSLRRDHLHTIIEKVVFPAGAALIDNDRWVIAYGVHEERCCLQVFDFAWLLKQCVSLNPPADGIFQK